MAPELAPGKVVIFLKSATRAQFYVMSGTEDRLASFSSFRGELPRSLAVSLITSVSAPRVGSAVAHEFAAGEPLTPKIVMLS